MDLEEDISTDSNLLLSFGLTSSFLIPVSDLDRALVKELTSHSIIKLFRLHYC
jgi:hypothetical protein